MFPYNLVLNFLTNKASDEDVQMLCDKYGVVESDDMFNILADLVSDSDLISIGFSLEDYNEDSNDTYDNEYNYDDVDDIVDFLVTCDEDVISDLLSHYGCYNLEDLALALTDSELENLGYSCCNDDGDSEYCGEICCSINDYSEGYDFLEEIPSDLPYILIEDGTFVVNSEADMLRFKECLDPNLIDDFIIQECIDDMHSFKIVPHKFEIKEEVIINKDLNPNIFDSEHKVIPEIREQLLDYIDGFVKYMSDKDIDVSYQDICLVGSNAGYLYTPESDIDVHIISSVPLNMDTAEDLFDEFDFYEAENPLFIGDSRVEIGIEDEYNIKVNDNDSRRYSLVNDDWVNDSDKLDRFTQDDLENVSGYEEIVSDYIDRINSAIAEDEYAMAVALKEEIRQNRSNDLANIGPLSMGNVVFKEIRNAGVYDKLREYIRQKELGSMILSE